MIWLATQLWGWMALAAVAGAALTTATSVRRRTTTRWVETAAPPEATPDLDGPAAASDAATDGATEDSRTSGSPFPEFRGLSTSPAPWEAEEEWSRPRAAV